MNKLRWGILGTAAIARKNWKGIWHSGNSIASAVASRNADRSRQFIADCQRENPFDPIPAALGNYEELLASPNVDAIYIPIPTGLRKEWVVRAVEAGKHVLCEKPCGASVADVREMLEACRRNRVQFMDGVMFMHNPRLDCIRQALDDKTSFGTIRRITSHFSFSSSEDFRQTNVRSDGALEPLGCLGDLGWYCIRIALWVMNWQMPREVSGRILSQTCSDASQRPVPFDFSAELFFDNDISSGFYCSFLAAYSNWVTVTGTKGHLRVPDFVLPKNSSRGALEINGSLSDDLIIDPLAAQDANMLRAFAASILSGKLNEAWPDWALKTQIVTNACLDSARGGPSGIFANLISPERGISTFHPPSSILYASPVHFRKITIVGVGLLGGSLGLAIKKRRLAGEVAGYVRRTASIAECKKAKAVDSCTCDLQQAVSGADLIVLCTPLAQMLPLLKEMLPAIKRGAIVTDVGSVKATVVKDLETLVAKAGAHFIGSHPMAGAEKTGVAAARADLFTNAVCVVTPTKKTNQTALRKTEQFWKTVGARVMRLTPQLHDELVSRSSHLPHVTAATLANLILDPAHPKSQPLLCANGFRDTTRIASGSPEMWRDIAMANRKNLGKALETFIRDLKKIQAVLKKGDGPAAEKFFRQGKQRRDAWCARCASPSPE